MTPRLALSYVLPLRWTREQTTDLTHYLERLAGDVDEIIVVDGSPPPLFDAHRELWSTVVLHRRPHPAFRFLNGKVDGVLTGVLVARHERIVLADDDVRYQRVELERVAALLDENDLVRPQNYFTPMVWHAVWDTGRSLINRAFGRDYPGTLGVRRSTLVRAGGYDGDVLFENLELIRTVEAVGGRIASPLDLYVARRPATARRFWSQRIRQAYDDFAIPSRMAVWLGLIPAATLAAIASPWLAAAFPIAAAAIAEAGRRRGGGTRVFPLAASIGVPLWVAERAVTSWMALGSRILYGGCRYGGATFVHAATPRRRLPARRLDLGLVEDGTGNDVMVDGTSSQGAQAWPRPEKGSRPPSSATRSSARS